METIAHRGCTGQFPENTLSAIQSVVDHVDRIELDVLQCGSGEIILFRHVSTETLTGTDYQVTSTEYETLRELPVLETDERIPTLAKALATIPSTVDVQIDLKARGIAADVRRVVDQYDHDLYLCSADADVLTEGSALSWDTTVGYVSFAHFQEADVDSSSVPHAELAEAVETAASLDASFIEVPYSLCLETDIVDAAHDADLDVVAWPIRTREQLDAIAAHNVDAAMLDRIDIL